MTAFSFQISMIDVGIAEGMSPMTVRTFNPKGCLHIFSLLMILVKSLKNNRKF
jgi:hypothetical protein